MQFPVLETAVGPVFESIAIARYSKTIDFPPHPLIWWSSEDCYVGTFFFSCCCRYSPEGWQISMWFFSHWFCEIFVSTDGALSFCMCVCYDAYCYVFLNFLAHIEPQTDFTSLEIEGNIQAWYRIGHAVYIRWVSYILFYYGIVLFPLGF